MTKKDFNRLQYIDKLKDDYCKKQNFLLYRFNQNSNLEEEIKNIYNILKEK